MKTNLPSITAPVYRDVLPSNEQEFTYRPFLVREEKLLQLIKDDGDLKQIYLSLQQLIKNCTGLNVDTLSVFDIEYIFLNIRAKSVGEVSKLRLLCPDDNKTYADVELDLNEVRVQVGEDHTNKIELDNGMGMIMQYPTIDSFRDSGIRNITADNMLDVIGSCILQIYEDEGKKVYDPKDQTKKEVIEFIEQLNTKQFKKVQNFFDTMPKLKHEIKVKNPKTKKESSITLTGLNDFFG